MLRKMLGDENFQAGIREYYRRYRDGNASTSDFRNVMEEVSGVKLDWFFEQWLSRAGTPVVEGQWSYLANAHQVRVELRQTQAGGVYRLPLEIGIDGVVHSFEMISRQQVVSFSAQKEPAAVMPDPDSLALIHIGKFGR